MFDGPKGKFREHGASGYVNGGCRCQTCREGHSAYQKNMRLKRKRRTSMLSQLPHGSSSTYTNWSCRCKFCCDAHTTANRETRQRQRTTSN